MKRQFSSLTAIKFSNPFSTVCLYAEEGLKIIFDLKRRCEKMGKNYQVTARLTLYLTCFESVGWWDFNYFKVISDRFFGLLAHCLIAELARYTQVS